MGRLVDEEHLPIFGQRPFAVVNQLLQTVDRLTQFARRPNVFFARFDVDRRERGKFPNFNLRFVEERANRFNSVFERGLPRLDSGVLRRFERFNELSVLFENNGQYQVLR